MKENLDLSVLNISISSSPQFPKHKQVKYPAHNYQIIHTHTHTQNPAQFSCLKLKGPSLISKNSISARKKYTQIPRSQIFISSIKNDKLKECDSLETGSKKMNQIEA